MAHGVVMQSSWKPLDLPAVEVERLKRGVVVQTRYFFADSVPGSKASVVRVRKDKHGNYWVRCNYGKNLSGQSLLKWMTADALAHS